MASRNVKLNGGSGRNGRLLVRMAGRPAVRWSERRAVWRASLALVMSKSLRGLWQRFPVLRRPAVVVDFFDMLKAEDGPTNGPVEAGQGFRAHCIEGFIDVRLRLLQCRDPGKQDARHTSSINFGGHLNHTSFRVRFAISESSLLRSRSAPGPDAAAPRDRRTRTS